MNLGFVTASFFFVIFIYFLPCGRPMHPGEVLWHQTTSRQFGSRGGCLFLVCARRNLLSTRAGIIPPLQLPSGDVDASASVSAPEVPSVEVEKPKKGLFGGIFGSSKSKVEVRCVEKTPVRAAAGAP